jgi:mono/diheme cytochrome c family protein
MKPHHRKWATSAVLAVAALALATGAALGFVRAGVYNIAADDPHYPMTYAMLEQLRDASIKKRASQLTPPKDLMSAARIRQGAGNYNAMCTQCHLAPGMAATELSKGLYPAPPNLTRETVDAAEAFWTIKHGIKASGMPAWGTSMGDEYIWNMAAFLQQLPKLDKAGYDALVATSGGHSHGGGETGEGAEHHHDEGEAAHEDMAMDMPMAGGHMHAPGTPAHDDAAPAPAHAHAPGTPPHDDTPVAGNAPAHRHAAGTPPHTDAPAHVDAPGTPPHSH